MNDARKQIASNIHEQFKVHNGFYRGVSAGSKGNIMNLSQATRTIGIYKIPIFFY